MPIPLIVNSRGVEPVQVVMNGSVGRGGSNQRTDTILIQSLLNAAKDMGTPLAGLKVDGVAGPKTIDAIQSFQSKTLGFSDGRVDPLGKTLRSLLELSARGGGLPSGLPNVSAVAPPFRPFTTPLVFPSLRDTAFRVSTTSGFSVSIGLGGLAAGHIYIEHDSGAASVLGFAGLTVGLTTLPVGLNLSVAAYPTITERISYVYPSREEPTKPEDFLGLCQMLCLSGNLAVVGGSMTMIFFGLLPLNVALTRVKGFIQGIPNLEICAVVGYVQKVNPRYG